MRIFISYRREDSSGYAGRLYDRLAAHFDGANIFMDIDAIGPGQNFVEAIEDAVGTSDAFIAIIGPRWLTVETDEGGRRLDNPNDFVRLEIAAALRRGILVIPTLVEGARVPRTSDLPEQLKELSVRNALEVSDGRFHHDVDRLIKALEEHGASMASLGSEAEVTEFEDDIESRLEQLYTQGLSAFWLEDWDQAIRILRGVVELRPGYQEAASRLQQAERRAEVARLYNEGQAAFDAQNWQVAIVVFEQLLQLEPDVAGAREKLELARNRQHVKELYTEAQQLSIAQEWHAVLNIFKQISKLDPDYQDSEGLEAAAKSEQAQIARHEELEALYARAVRMMDAGELQRAQNLFLKLEQMEPGYRGTTSLLEKLETEIARTRLEQREEVVGRPRRGIKGQVRSPQALPGYLERLRRLPAWVWFGAGLITVGLLALWIGSLDPISSPPAEGDIDHTAAIEANRSAQLNQDARNGGGQAATDPLAPCGDRTSSSDNDGEGDVVEVFSWWTAGGEAEGLAAMVDVFADRCPEYEVTWTSTEFSDFRYIIPALLSAGDSPDSWHESSGHGVIGIYVAAGQIAPLNDLYEQYGWQDVLPDTLIPLLSQDDNIYSVPVNIHRANVMWYNPTVLAEHDLAVPTTWEEFFAAADELQDAGITPLAVGDRWTAMQLFETVLLGSMSVEAYNGLWDGTSDWAGLEVNAAIENFLRALDYVNSDAWNLYWVDAAQLVAEGDAAFIIMGDFVKGLEVTSMEGFGWAPSPGTDGIFQFMSWGSFVLPVGEINREGALAFLTVAGSREGQEAFNTSAGSICARTDCDTSLFDEYLQSSMADWRTDIVVGSLMYGAVGNDDWMRRIDDALGMFLGDRDAAAFQQALANACASAGPCQ